MKKEHIPENAIDRFFIKLAMVLRTPGQQLKNPRLLVK